MTKKAVYLLAMLCVTASAPAADTPTFHKQAALILKQRCLSCHNSADKRGGLSLETRSDMLAGGDSGAVIEPGAADSSLLVEVVSGKSPEMPKDAKPLTTKEVEAIRRWIDAGAVWPQQLRLKSANVANLDWWSLQPLVRPPLPNLSQAESRFTRTSIDPFIVAKLREHGLNMSAEADRRTLIRRLYFDLIGLPPSPADVDSFMSDRDPLAYEKLVDRLLASPHYGERWARHWLDVVHYGDTHGYDKDKLRPHAWPYRDYVIRSFNQDKPYGRFVQEQVAGDVLSPETTDGIVATGFLAAGPWDFIGHAEVPESKIDGKVARHLDRDDMVRTVFETFNSTTVGCAQCHDHKFDPVSLEDYYSLQAVFAAIDRADRDYETDDRVAQRRRELLVRQRELESQRESLEDSIHQLAGPRLGELDRRIAELEDAGSTDKNERAEFGYHSKIETRPDIAKWVQVDLGKQTELARIVVVACHDNFNNIGAGFGFPLRFRIEASDDPQFKSAPQIIVDHTGANYANPGVTPQVFAVGQTSDLAANNQVSGRLPLIKARYVRVTATKLVNRLADDYIFTLGELLVFDTNGNNVSLNKSVTSLDSIEAPVRWRRSNLVDGYYYGNWHDPNLEELAELNLARTQLLDGILTADMIRMRQEIASALATNTKSIHELPAKGKVYAGCVHHGSGNFRGRGGLGPREVFVLHRGQVMHPGKAAEPGTIPIIRGFNPRFELPPNHAEGERRLALARWLTRHDHPLTWRSIVNRVWQYHFGRGIVDSPNDFGRMGQMPSHPQLLDWLACEFRDNGQSIKQLQRLIVCSAAYRQTSLESSNSEIKNPNAIDSENRLLWRMNRRKLEAEAVRDAILLVAGKLDTRMYGPGFRDFVLEKPEHSPHYEYDKHDPNDPAIHRRSIYRFLVRSQPQPWMDTLDCADPSLMVGKRNETITALQALSLLNSRFVVAMSEQFAEELEDCNADLRNQLASAIEASLSRDAIDSELDALVQYAGKHGLANACRLILNMSEFSFVD